MILPHGAGRLFAALLPILRGPRSVAPLGKSFQQHINAAIISGTVSINK